MAIEVRAITEAELPAMLEVDTRGFGARPRTPDRPDSWVRAELDRTRCAFDDGEMLGCTRAYSFELTMPGGALVPIAAVSAVAVQPTHRRRGVLTTMIDALHTDARDRGGAHRVGEQDLRSLRVWPRDLAPRLHRRSGERPVRPTGRRPGPDAHG